MPRTPDGGNPPELQRPPAGTEGQESQRGRDDDDLTVTEPTTSQLLRHALSLGDPSVVAVVRRIVDGRAERQAAALRARREREFDTATIERLEMDDRRRDAARRLPRLCDDRGVDHNAARGVDHGLVCVDPLAGGVA